jgi:hypothetical protein
MGKWKAAGRIEARRRRKDADQVSVSLRRTFGLVQRLITFI